MSPHSVKLETIELEIDATRGRIDSTLDALTEKVSASRLVGQAFDSMRENGGMFAGNLVHTARDNPVAVTLLATSLAWLMISDRRGRPGFPHAHAQPGAGMAGATASERTEAASSAVRKVGDGAQRAGDAIRGATAQVGDAAAQARAAAGDVAASARATAHDLRDRVGHVGEEAGRRAVDAYAGARDVTRRAGSYLAENPLMIGALGLAIGAVIAAALPSTRREDEWLGEVGDKVRDEAASAARQVAREGTRIAEAAVDSVKDEASHRTLAPEDGREAAADGATRVVRGAAAVTTKSAVQAAEEEARRRTGNGSPQPH